MVLGGDSCSEGRGFESWHHILDAGHFSHIFVSKIVLMFEWKDDNKQKRGRGWPIFQQFRLKLKYIHLFIVF